MGRSESAKGRVAVGTYRKRVPHESEVTRATPVEGAPVIRGGLLMGKVGDIDCSSFTPVYDIAKMKVAEGDGLTHVLEYAGRDGSRYEGPTPFMVQNNAIGFLQRENGIADAKRRGWREPRGQA